MPMVVQISVALQPNYMQKLPSWPRRGGSKADGVVCVKVRFQRIHKSHPALRAPLLGRRGVFARF